MFLHFVVIQGHRKVEIRNTWSGQTKMYSYARSFNTGSTFI